MIDKNRRERMIRLYSFGKSLTKIAKTTSTSPNTVIKYLRLEGISPPAHNMVYGLYHADDVFIGIYIGLWAGDGTQYYDQGYCIKICCHRKDGELILFIQQVLLHVFNKTTSIVYGRGRQANVRFKSKYIYRFVNDYVSYTDHKTHSVRLTTRNQSQEFLHGYLLGLMLTDGHLNNRMHFNTTSIGLAKDILFLLQSQGLHPHLYTHRRTHLGWHDLYMISLTKFESKVLCVTLDDILRKTGYLKGFKVIKGYKK